MLLYCRVRIFHCANDSSKLLVASFGSNNESSQRKKERKKEKKKERQKERKKEKKNKRNKERDRKDKTTTRKQMPVWHLSATLLFNWQQGGFRAGCCLIQSLWAEKVKRIGTHWLSWKDVLFLFPFALVVSVQPRKTCCGGAAEIP